ncbi:MAG TPA: S8 family peptidase [Thermoleophilaceae bacterium]|nr:S8 family peptidase [Thermoleophilaceae bacterium]
MLTAGADFAGEGSISYGFGDKYAPQTLVEARRVLGPQVASVRESVAALPDRLRGERVYVRATLLPNYLAGSYHPDELREAADLVVVGTRPARGTLKRPKSVEHDCPTKALLLAATGESLETLAELVERAQPDSKFAKDLIKLQDFALPGTERVTTSRPRERPTDEQETDEEVVWEAVLHPAVDRGGRISREAHELVLARWGALVESLEGEVRSAYEREVANLTFVPVRLRRSRVSELAKFNPLRSIRPMPRMRPLPVPGSRGVPVGAAVPSVPPGGPRASDRIAVFDGGVDNSHPLLAPFVTEGDLTSAARDDDAVAHGTLVTSALLYGPVELGRALEPPPAHVDHFRVLPPPPGVDEDDEPYWVLDRVVETLRAHPDRWRLVNLSYGPDETVDEGGDVDRFTAEVDLLAYDLGLTFVVAVGNEGSSTISTLGDDRVMAPADGVNVLGVGACDAPAPEALTRADYSCVGPGRPGLRVQPLGVSFGGAHARLFTGAAPNGGLQASLGTSFAAPSAARGLATLLPVVPELSPTLARGLAAHFADGADTAELVELGYGRLPGDYRPLLECSEGEVTVVVRDTIQRGGGRSYALPYPRGGAGGIVETRWTISFTSPTDPQDPVEYTLAGLELLFRPHVMRYKMTKKGEKPKTVDLRESNALNQLLTDGWELGRQPLPRPAKQWRSEQTLREDGKWETVMRHEDSMRSASLFLPELIVAYLERSQGKLVPARSAQRELDFTLVMTVRSRRTADIYERVLADSRFHVLTPLAPVVAVQA